MSVTYTIHTIEGSGSSLVNMATDIRTQINDLLLEEIPELTLYSTTTSSNNAVYNNYQFNGECVVYRFETWISTDAYMGFGLAYITSSGTLTAGAIYSNLKLTAIQQDGGTYSASARVLIAKNENGYLITIGNATSWGNYSAYLGYYTNMAGTFAISMLWNLPFYIYPYLYGTSIVNQCNSGVLDCFVSPTGEFDMRRCVPVSLTRYISDDAPTGELLSAPIYITQYEVWCAPTVLEDYVFLTGISYPDIGTEITIDGETYVYVGYRIAAKITAEEETA